MTRALIIAALTVLGCGALYVGLWVLAGGAFGDRVARGSGAVKIPRGDWDAPGPCWVPMRTSSGAPSKPVVVCRCGGYFSLGLHHVYAGGRVTASFLHPECGFHEFLELDGYDGPDLAPSSRSTP